MNSSTQRAKLTNDLIATRCRAGKDRMLSKVYVLSTKLFTVGTVIFGRRGPSPCFIFIFQVTGCYPSFFFFFFLLIRVVYWMEEVASILRKNTTMLYFSARVTIFVFCILR